jgi:hypothetical protein
MSKRLSFVRSFFLLLIEVCVAGPTLQGQSSRGSGQHGLGYQRRQSTVCVEEGALLVRHWRLAVCATPPYDDGRAAAGRPLDCGLSIAPLNIFEIWLYDGVRGRSNAPWDRMSQRAVVPAGSVRSPRPARAAVHLTARVTADWFAAFGVRFKPLRKNCGNETKRKNEASCCCRNG